MVVKLVNETGQIDSVQTDSSGYYRFSGLKEGVYQMFLNNREFYYPYQPEYVIITNGVNKEKNLTIYAKDGNQGKGYRPGKRARRAALKTRNKQISRFTVNTGYSTNNNSQGTVGTFSWQNGHIQRENSEEYAKVAETGFKQVETDPLSTFSIDVDKASYANVRRFLEDGSLPPKDAVRIEEIINYFEYDNSTPTGDAPLAG